MNTAAPPHRLPRPLLGLALALVSANLLLGMAGGLVRLGLGLPLDAASALHGVLLVDGVFGTLLALRWAWAAGRALALLAALLAGVCGLLAAFGVPLEWPLSGWLAAGLATLALQLTVAARQRWPLWIGIAMLASLAWCLGTLLWLQGGLAHDALVAWMSFVVLAFVAERRARVPQPRIGPASRACFGIAVALLPLACLATVLRGTAWLPRSTAAFDLPALLFWLGAGLLAAWSLPHDLRRLRNAGRGWPATIAQALLLGDAWLLAAALLGLAQRWLLVGAPGPAWHALFVGFGVSSALGLIAAPACEDLLHARRLRLALWLLSACLVLRIATASLRHPAALAASGIALAAAITWIVVLGLRRVWSLPAAR